MKVRLHHIMFPGIIFHEFSHYIACLLFGVRVKKVRWIGVHEAYVVHEQPTAWKALGITIAPFILGNGLAWLLLSAANRMLSSPNPLALVYYWFSISLLFYAFPSEDDAANAFRSFIETFRQGILRSRSWPITLGWLALLPVLFVPLAVVLGAMLAFAWFFALRLVWMLLVMLAAYDPMIIRSVLAAFGLALKAILRFFI